MNILLRFRKTALRVVAALLATTLALPGFAQDETKVSPAAGAASAGQPDEAEMMKQMMELAKLNENHKLLVSWSALGHSQTKCG